LPAAGREEPGANSGNQIPENIPKTLRKTKEKHFTALDQSSDGYFLGMIADFRRRSRLFALAAISNKTS
jgi:hypothetical protein